MLYGAAYYHEYQPYERLAEDIRLMREAGLTVVRLGESTWSSWEPEDGRFEFAWMDRVIDAMHEAGIKVILGTPSYAIPAWLHRKFPEIMAQYERGSKAYYGARQNMNHAHPAYRFHVERVVRQLVSHYAPHPAIIGYQVDNETGSGLLYNPDVFQKFVDYLKHKFQSVDRLNEVWGLTYWSHRLGGWDDLWTPDGNTNPGYDLEWRRFQATLVTDLLAWEKNIVKEYARPDQFVTQCVVGMHGRAESDVYDIAQEMDVLAMNPYHVTQDGLNLALGEDRVFGAPEWMAQFQISNPGVWSMSLAGDFARGSKQTNFLITELNANSIGGSHCNYPNYDGQWRSVVYTFISRGANMVEYWHWHTLHYGIETYWGGIINHDLEPGRCYAEISQIAHELQAHDAILTDLQPQEDVAFLYSQDSKYALEFMPSLPQVDNVQPDKTSYRRTFDAFYKGFFDARAQCVVLHEEQNFEAYPVLVVPSLYIADDAFLERLTQYAANGGHLLLTFKSGYADEFARIRWHRAPGPLREAVGANYNEFSNLVTPLLLKSVQPDFVLPADARATGWADGLQLEGATALAAYEHPHFGRFPAIISQPYGKGRVTYCGTRPNTALSKALAQWVLAQAGITSPFADLPTVVRASTARAKSGETLTFYTNWSWDTQQVPAASGGTDLISGASIPSGASFELGAWDTRIIVTV
jgi:beta-galactosidase